MACLWRAIVDQPASLRLILGCLEPSVAYFNLYKKVLLGVTHPDDLSDFDPVSVAAMKVACHQMSYSGLGTMAGGPIGGAGQASKYDVGCRFDAARIARNIATARDILTSVELHLDVCTSLDVEEVVRAPGEAIMYLDTPYYKAGPALYQVAFTHDDHVRLAQILRHEGRPWLLSYDRHPVIEELYGTWASVEEVSISYLINGAVRSSELLISNVPVKTYLE
jgi:DNA adenine methylase